MTNTYSIQNLFDANNSTKTVVRDVFSYTLSGIVTGLTLEFASRYTDLELLKDYQASGRPLTFIITSTTGVLTYTAGNQITDYIESLEGYKYHIATLATGGFITGGMTGALIGTLAGLSTPIEYFSNSPFNIVTSITLTSIIGFGATAPWTTIIGAGLGSLGVLCYNYPATSLMTISGVIVGTALGHHWLGGAIGVATAATYKYYKDSITLIGDNNPTQEDISL